ncbi:hypothetical protein WJX79_002183 [Trebouxia sp. C0005]
MTFDGLVPENFEEFRSVKFWDGFFQKRNRKAFEWYGEWKQLQPLVWGACARPNKQILMLGCGNSDLSAQMYDAGCRSIVNIDFSKICIKEMMIKNLRQRPQMKWIVMDMTQMTFKDESFHIAVDKGALDALMGEDTDAAGIAGGKLLSEVQRVLASCDGQYLCVTLGQTHVLTTLLSTFGLGWGIAIDRIPPSPDMAKSPLQPLLVTVMRIPQPTSKQETRERQHEQQQNEVDGQIDDDYTEDGQCSDVVQDKQACTAVPLVQLSFGAEAGVVNSEQLADVIKVVEQENRLRASVVLDVDAAAAKRAVRDCAVFIVPQGREHEWLFSSPEGQGQVAQGCSAKRVVLVSLNRGHTFGSMKAVQGELSPLVMDLAPIASRQLEAAIPFMTTQEGIGSRTVLEEAESALTGRISIEDITVQNDGGGGLPVFLNKHCGMDVQSVELDPVVVDLARRHFGFADSASLQATVGDGFEAHARQVLKAGGMLVVNCVSRVVEPYKAAVKALQRVFAEVYELDVDEDVNKVLFALLQPLQDKPGTHQSKSNGRTHKKGKSVSLRAQASGLYQTSFPVDGSANHRTSIHSS